MKTIRFWSSNHWNPDVWRSKFRVDPLQFRFVRDNENPDYLFGTEQLWTDIVARRNFLRLFSYERVIIYFAHECIFPDMNLFDYAIAFDRNAVLGDRIHRIPVLSFYPDDVFERFDIPFKDADSELGRKTGFCNFIYSNPRAAPRRDQLFHAISTYRRVDSLGPHLNNCGNRTSRTDKDWHRLAVEMRRPYKFSISCENAVCPGYVSEKILSAFQAHTVPIYWGDPSIATEFNPKAFINANNMSDGEVCEIVRTIDQNDSLWSQMVSEPPLLSHQLKKAEVDELSFRRWSDCLFSSSIRDVVRKPYGFWPANYFRAFSVPPYTCNKIFSRISRLGHFLRMKSHV